MDEASANGGAAGEPGPSGPRGGLPPVVRAGCAMLMVAGILSTVLIIGALFSPESTRCDIARSWIEDANDDDDTYNDVDTEGTEPDDIGCDEAVLLADQIRVDEEAPSETTSVPSETAVRFQGGLAAAVGLGGTVAGLVTMRTLSRRARAVALGFAVLGVTFQVLGILSMAAMAFVLYALGFSAASKAIWPRARRARPDPKADPEES